MTALAEHLARGLTTLCRCWAVERTDGIVFGFTDHDLPLAFEGIEFRAQSGLTARAMVAGTGLSVDNSEAMGALTSDAITEADIEAGRYDGAQVRLWLVNWAAPEERMLRFRGHIGELRRGGGAFHAELRGLTEGLNQPQGRVYQRPCTAVLGDNRCRFDTSDEAFSTEIAVEELEGARVFHFSNLTAYEPGWFERGRLEILDGPAKGEVGLIKSDRLGADGQREIALWDGLRGGVDLGDRLRLIAGCDKRADTCRFKFNNFLNFQGFPDIPGEDWLAAVPRQNGANTGGSLRR